MKIQTTQCDHCAFKITEDQSTYYKDRFVAAKYDAIRATKNAPEVRRKLHLGLGDTDNNNKTETCFLNSSLFTLNKDNIYCPDRVDNVVSLETALDLREAREANAIASKAAATARDANAIASKAAASARDARIWAIMAAIIATAGIAIPYIKGAS